MRSPCQNLDSLSHLGCERGGQVRGHVIGKGGGGGLEVEVCDNSLTAGQPVPVGISNTGNFNSVETSPLSPGLNLSPDMTGMKDRYKARIGMWNVGTLTGRLRELAEYFEDGGGEEEES